MKEIFLSDDFDVDETSLKINNIMSKWSIGFLDINGPSWVVYTHDMKSNICFSLKLTLKIWKQE